MDDHVTIAQLPEHLIDDGLSYMCDLCWLKMNDDRAKEGLSITPFPLPNEHQKFGDSIEEYR